MSRHQHATEAKPQARSSEPSAQTVDTWLREYHRTYYREHRGAAYLTSEELEQCRRQPALTRDIRGNDFIACLECGVLLKSLAVHLAHEHKLKSRKYGRKWNLPIEYPLVSKTFVAKAVTNVSSHSPRPLCQKQGCPRQGRRLELRSISPVILTKGRGTKDVSHYVCWGRVGRLRKWGKEHSEYGGPNGEIVTRLGHGRYVWRDSKTGEQFEGRSRMGIKPLHMTPLCELKGCRREGTRMHLNKVLVATLKTGDTCKIGHYDCRGSKHYAFRILPSGEIPERLGRGRYRWQDRQSREWFETLSPLASLRKELANLRIAGSEAAVKPRKYGPAKTPAVETVWFSEGRKVQELIDKGSPQARARHIVANASHREYATVEQYHKRYRAWLKANAQ